MSFAVLPIIRPIYHKTVWSKNFSNKNIEVVREWVKNTFVYQYFSFSSAAHIYLKPKVFSRSVFKRIAASFWHKNIMNVCWRTEISWTYLHGDISLHLIQKMKELFQYTWQLYRENSKKNILHSKKFRQNSCNSYFCFPVLSTSDLYLNIFI